LQFDSSLNYQPSTLNIHLHTIRLRGPWELEPVARFVQLDDGRYERIDGPLITVRAKLPADWANALGRDFLGSVCYRRTFQRPTGLKQGQRVWLIVEPPRSCCVVTLNDYSLGAVLGVGDPGKFEIRELLRDHNWMDILVHHPSLDAAGFAKNDINSQMPGGLVGEVRLEIDE
jgi:hypothetical protein